MADRRMFHKKVVESDPFYQLSDGAQAIYMHLCMNADDDGFVNNAKGITSQFKGGPSKLAQLVEKRFVLKFGDVYVIKHWRIGNSLKNDRMKLPTYPGVAAKIWIKPNRSYTDHSQEGCPTLLDVKTGIQMESKWNPRRTELNRTELNRTEPRRPILNNCFILIQRAVEEVRRPGSRLSEWRSLHQRTLTQLYKTLRSGNILSSGKRMAGNMFRT